MDNKTAPNANAFASTFYFYLRKMQPHEKIKRACKPTHGTVQGFGANLTRQCFDRERSPAGNSTFAIGGVSCSADSFVVTENRSSTCSAGHVKKKMKGLLEITYI